VPHDQDGGITLAVIDRHVNGHADWAIPRSEGVAIAPGEPVVLEWEEAYSVGRGNYQTATYRNVPPGLYRFSLRGLTVMGLPDGAEASVRVIVPVAWWTMPWFYGSVCLAFASFVFAGWRITERRRMIRQFKALERDRALEQERMRIAQDIHDDLGARVTQISLVSSAAQQRQDISEAARKDFEQVSGLSASIVTALYETVWAVSPENDHLDELGAYICQMTTQLCAQANVKCRLAVPDLPHDTPIGSKFRHEIIMVVKEAVHNVIKHSRATELQIHIQFENGILLIIMRDNGKGFDPGVESEGHGLANMKRRIKSCGGTCLLQSRGGGGTEVRLELPLPEDSASTVAPMNKAVSNPG
jgi:signal transduction histidine kinase